MRLNSLEIKNYYQHQYYFKKRLNQNQSILYRTEVITMTKRALYVHLISFGLTILQMSGQCFADAASDFAQAKQISTASGTA